MEELYSEALVVAGAFALAVVLALLLYLARKLGKFIDVRKDATQKGTLQNTLWTIAEEAYAYAEKVGRGMAGSEKMERAYEYASKELAELNIFISPARIEAVIEKAWVILEKLPKTTGTTTNIHYSADVTSKENMAEEVAKHLKEEVDRVVGP